MVYREAMQKYADKKLEKQRIRGTWMAMSVRNKSRSSLTWLRLETKWTKSTDRLFQYILHLTRPEIRVLWHLFNTADADGSRTLAVGELLNVLGLEHSTFANKMFCMMDVLKGIHISGVVDFESFVVSLWNICSLQGNEVPCFIFELYNNNDRDGDVLDFEEVTTLVVDICTRASAQSARVARIMQALRTLVSSEGGVTKEAFTAFCETRPLFLAPALLLRSRMRQAFGGDKFWDRITQRRHLVAGISAGGDAKEVAASHTSAAFVVLRRLIMERNFESGHGTTQRRRHHATYSASVAHLISSRRPFLSTQRRVISGFDVKANMGKLLEQERHRARKAIVIAIEAAIENRSMSLASRSGTTTPAMENPVALAFRERKLAALDLNEEIDRIAADTILDAKIIQDANFLEHDRLTKDMRRDRTFEEEKRLLDAQRDRLKRWIDRTRDVDELLRQGSLGGDDDLDDGGGGAEEVPEIDDKADPEEDLLLEEHHSGAVAELLAHRTVAKRKKLARRRWAKVRQRAKDAYARILADRRDLEREQAEVVLPQTTTTETAPGSSSRRRKRSFLLGGGGGEKRSRRRFSLFGGGGGGGGPSSKEEDDSAESDAAAFGAVMTSGAAQAMTNLLHRRDSSFTKSPRRRRSSSSSDKKGFLGSISTRRILAAG